MRGYYIFFFLLSLQTCAMDNRSSRLTNSASPRAELRIIFSREVLVDQVQRKKNKDSQDGRRPGERKEMVIKDKKDNGNKET